MATGQATINFGAASTDVATAVASAAILAGSLVECWIFPATTATNTPDNHWIDDIHVVAGNVLAGIGFTIYATCKTGVAHGQFNIGWAWV